MNKLSVNQSGRYFNKVSKLVGKVKRRELGERNNQSSIRCEEKITTTVTTCQLQLDVQNISCVYSGLYLLCSAATATSGDAVEGEGCRDI